MSGESARSLRKAVIAVGMLGALSLSVPALLWLAPGPLFQVLQPVGQPVQARVVDEGGRLLDDPARLRPGSSTELVVTGFDPGQSVLLRSSESTAAFSAGRADQGGVFRYRLKVPASMSGAHSLTVIGEQDQTGGQPRGSAPKAVFRYVISADRAGDRPRTGS